LSDQVELLSQRLIKAFTRLVQLNELIHNQFCFSTTDHHNYCNLNQALDDLDEALGIKSPDGTYSEAALGCLRMGSPSVVTKDEAMRAIETFKDVM